MYDLIIIGSGPAGLSSSIYASCFKLNHVVIGKVNGGQMALAPDILNYPGFEEISGIKLTENMVNQLKKRGGEIINESVVEIVKNNNSFNIKTETDKSFESKSIILATGVERKKLNVPGEIEYTGKGVKYCATGEKFDYLDKVTAIVGGANSAAQTAVQLSHAASKVYIIYRGSDLRADPIWLSKIKEIKNIEILYNTQIVEVLGDSQKLTSAKIKSTQANGPVTEIKELKIDQLYVEIGGVPGTALLIPLGVKMDPGGYIEVDEKLQTSVSGVFAAGDVVSHKYSIEQISSAVGSGARSTVSAFSYLKGQNAPSLWGSSQIQRPTQQK